MVTLKYLADKSFPHLTSAVLNIYAINNIILEVVLLVLTIFIL